MPKMNDHSFQNWVWILGTLVIMGIAAAFSMSFKVSSDNSAKLSEVEGDITDGMHGILGQIHAHETGSSGSHIGMDERIKSIQRDIDMLSVRQQKMAEDIIDIKTMVRSE